MDELISLSDATLDRLSIKRPEYDRSHLTPGIVHIGVGNFHRAHQAWYLHRLMQAGQAHDWAIIGAGVRPYDAAMREKLLAQDCLTTLVELDPADTSAEVVGSMIDYLPIEVGNASLIRKMADPAIRIVAMTVTESGYYVDPVSKGFDAAHPDIVHDAANPTTPRTAFGAMIAALRLRRDAGHGPFTGLSCDNLQGNGAILRQTVTSLARMSDPALADWIDANATFPNSMVDCIVPATGLAERALAKGFGIRDAAVVTHEAFRQWGHRRQVLRRTSKLGSGRRDVFGRCSRLRDDENPHPERWSPSPCQCRRNHGDRDHRRVHGHAACCALLPQSSGRGNHANSSPGSRHDACRIRFADRAALFQPAYRGHHPPRGI